jgi:hypothetical protein
MTERAFRAKFVEQRFRLIEGVRRHILGLEQVTEAALNLGFGKQSETSRPRLRSALRSGLGDYRAIVRYQAHNAPSSRSL